MKPSKDVQPSKSRPRKRFRVQKLEERVAPRANGWTNPKNPHYTQSCGSTGSGTLDSCTVPY